MVEDQKLIIVEDDIKLQQMLSDYFMSQGFSVITGIPIDNRVVTLRKKLNDTTTPPKKILTVRGKGYMFMPDTWNE